MLVPNQMGTSMASPYKSFSERIGLQGLREINNLRANVLSEFIKNHVMLCYAKEQAINRGYRLFTLIKSIFRSVIVFLDVIVNQVGSLHELLTSVQQESSPVEALIFSGFFFPIA